MSIDKLLGGGGDSAEDLSNQSALDRGKAIKNLDSASAIYSAVRGMGAAEVRTYRANYKPVENKAINTASKGLTARVLKPGLYKRTANYEGITDMRGAASRDASRQFDIARGSLTRDLARYGIAPGSGAGVSALASNSLGEAAARAGAMTRAGVEQATMRREEGRYNEAQDFNRRAYLDSENERRLQLAESTTFQRRNTVGQQGRQVYNDGMRSITGAAAGLTNVGQVFMGSAQDLQNQAADAAQAGGSGIGDLISSGIKIYGMTQGAPIA